MLNCRPISPLELCKASVLVPLRRLPGTLNPQQHQHPKLRLLLVFEWIRNRLHMWHQPIYMTGPDKRTLELHSLNTMRAL